MWKGPNPDLEGDPPEGTSQITRELSDLKDENEQQKVLIAQLKEMLRKEQSNVSQEKIDEYVNTLKKMTAKKSKGKKQESSGTEKHKEYVESGKTEKLNLLKQQLEQNKAKLAERGKNQKGIEDMVTQLKAELNDSQQLINSSPMLLVDPKTLEYSKTTNPEELYNILIMKEQKITELMSRTQRQEARILDLQENLKEKDSVIDARTKAITLMTDSLSKKGKTTLDALDETKEQMRKMQENFITLESEMRARQFKLLEDLKIKNFEIQELKEINDRLLNENQPNVESNPTEIIVKNLQRQLEVTQGENEKFLEKIANLEKELNDTLEDLTRLKNTGVSIEKPAGNENEILKLKKQIEESNKNMIKMKAQSKSKIKDLTKKLETFKKMNDTNALILELQNENTKLSERVAELEEEKGNLQLGMVESTESVKDPVLAEENKILQEKIAQNLEELNEKDKVISLLEADIIGLKEEISSLNTQIASLSHLENAQVTSEMKSVQIEEQLDQLESENSKLKDEIENLQTQKRELIEKLEEFTKEKLELGAKLDNYIQENIDLIDKLEKLSAEKVSSAESIEIVEGLTQQEKIELAAYQKTLDVNLEGPVKIVEDDVLEAPPELNESVHQLTEDSAELLMKIEMFNAERKEVMSKMEALKEENNSLSLKVQEIENNRDILADTYEHLQTEKEDILKEKEMLEEKLKILESGLEIKAAIHEDSDVASQLHSLQTKYDKLLEENDSLRATMKTFDTKIHEKDELEAHITKFRNKIDELETKLRNSLQEITNYESIIEENKNELISSANTINNLEMKLSHRETELTELNVLINDLNIVVGNLQAENEKIGNFEFMETKFEELKTALNSQIEQAQNYAEEIEHNKGVIADLNDKLSDMNRKILDTEHEIEAKDIEMEKLKQETMNRDDTITNLQSQIEEKDEKMKVLISEMKDKYLSLQRQLDGNSETLQRQVEELTHKNKEQLEKMKKIAANLKKKTQAYQDLEERYQGEKEKWEMEQKEKETLVCQVKDLKEETDQKTNKLKECEVKIKELSDMVKNLEQELENSMIEMRRKQEKLNEVSLKQELSTSLHEEFDEEHGINDSTKDEKIKELELIIETNEFELSHLKDRFRKLEEELEKSFEDREHIENQRASLENQLILMSKNIEEKTLVQEELTQKLQQVSADDDLLARKLEETNTENNELLQKTKEHEELIKKLKIKLKKAHEKVAQLESSQETVGELEATNKELTKQLAHLENIHRHALEENEILQKKYQIEYEKIENDYQIQLEELVKVRNELMVECEKLREELKSYKDKEDELLEEISELKSKAGEFDKFAKELEQMSRNLEESSAERNNSLKEIEFLKATIENQKLEIEDFQKQLVQRTAQEAIQEVITEAADHVVTVNTKNTQTEIEHLPVVLAEPSSEIKEVEEVKPTVMSTFQWPDDESTSQQENVFHMEQPIVQSHNRIAVQSTSQTVLPPCLSEVESQILSDIDIIDAASNKQALQEIEFEKVHSSFGEQNQPVVEDVVKPKQAYLTFQPGVEAFGENDDGWGWGPEESRLEDEHQHLTENTPQVQNLKRQLAQATEKLQVLQLERENHLEEIKQLQVKSGKLIKKCRELKVQNDQLLSQRDGKKTKDEFFDLNDAIQEELKSQIVSLEKRIKEITTDLEKERSEKKNILNRVDVLTAANERMLEMKEIQDTEVLRWKRKYEETEEKLHQYEWGSDGFSERPPLKQSEASPEETLTIEELQKTIQELSLDNEELQSLLNEQRELRIQAEKSKPRNVQSIPPELETKIKQLEHELTVRNVEIQGVLEEKSNMIDSLRASLSQKECVVESLEEELSNKTKEHESILLELNNLKKNMTLMNTELREKAEAYLNLQQSFNHLNTVGTNIQQLKQCLEHMKEEKLNLETLLNDKDNQLKEVYNQLNVGTVNTSELEEIRNKFKQSEHEKSHLESLLNEKNTTLDQLKSDLNDITSKFVLAEETKTNLGIVIKNQESALSELKTTHDSEYSKYKEDIAQLTQYRENKIQLEALITEKDAALNQYKIAYDQVIGLNDSLAKQNETLTVEMENLKQKVSELQEINRQQQETMEQLQIDKSVTTFEKKYEDNIQLEEQANKLQEELASLKIQKQEVDLELERVRSTLEEKQREFELVINDLENKWAAQVDERGNTIAESWKYHLNMVETEFASVQEKFKNEINELEEKCNALVNENNELRKNVDAEIKNEVDKISALQHQINDKQQKINDLSLHLNQAQQENNSMKERFASMSDSSEKDAEIKRLKFVLDTTQQQFEEKREVLEEIVKILEKLSPNPITLQKEDILNHFGEQLRKISEYENEIHQMRLQNKQMEKDLELAKESGTVEELKQLLQEKQNDIVRLNGEIETFRTFQNAGLDKDDEIMKLKEDVNNLQKHLSTLSEYEKEVISLHAGVEEYKKQIDQLHQNISLLQEEKSSLTYYFEDGQKQLSEALQSQSVLQSTIDQYNQQIQTLNQQLQQYENYKNDSNKNLEQLHMEIARVKETCQSSQKSHAECQQQLFTTMQELSEKEHALSEVMQKLNNNQQHVDSLENELHQLRQTIQVKEREYAESFEIRLREIETQYEEALGAKNLDLEYAQTQLQESLQYNQLLTEKIDTETKLRMELEIKTSESKMTVSKLEEKLTEQLKLMEEEEKQLLEMRAIIEEQVVKIEELKKELFEKSNDYDSLVAEMDMGKKSLLQQQSDAKGVESVASASKSYQEVDDLSEPVSRAELDLALYMLHQRDVKCEELMVELMQLLEERDTLQLRLSNAIREKEELMRKAGVLGSSEPAASSSTPSQESSSPSRSRSSQIFLAASGVELAPEASETLGTEQDLATKLSELKMVGYKKDKTFVDEQQLRRLQQMSIMQQHIQEAAKLPPEAAAKLVDANYTLSRDVQSPSKVLLNWLWGRSTPKQNDS